MVKNCVRNLLKKSTPGIDVNGCGFTGGFIFMTRKVLEFSPSLPEIRGSSSENIRSRQLVDTFDLCNKGNWCIWLSQSLGLIQWRNSLARVSWDTFKMYELHLWHF